MKKEHLYIAASVIWGIPGIIITFKGISSYLVQSPENLWWLLLVTSAVLAGFFHMFRRIVKRYSDRIESLSGSVRISDTFPLRGWILLVFMMGLGMAIRRIPGIPSAFIASFYSGLGPMLLFGSMRFAIGSRNVNHKS